MRSPAECYEPAMPAEHSVRSSAEIRVVLEPDARSSRSGSSTKMLSETARTTPSCRSARRRTVVRVTRRDVLRDALNVKSREARSASIPSPSGVKSTVSSTPSATTARPVPLRERKPHRRAAAKRCAASGLGTCDVDVEHRRSRSRSRTHLRRSSLVVAQDPAEALIHRPRPRARPDRVFRPVAIS